MKKCRVKCVLLALAVCSCFLAPALSWAETELTGITVFACDEHGTVNPALRFNTGPVDPAWDLFLAQAPADAAGSLSWLNGADNRIHVSLTPGTHTFVLHFDSPGMERFMGMNLFFDGEDGVAGVSGYVETGTGETASLKANASGKTQGIPFTDIPGAGTLEFVSGPKGFWTAGAGMEPGLKIALTEFTLTPPAEGGIDLVGQTEPAPSGVPDVVGRFTLVVTEEARKPMDLFHWLRTQGGMTTLLADGASAEGSTGTADAPASPPFSFRYGDENSTEFLSSWGPSQAFTYLDDARTQSTVTYTDPKSGLEVRWEGIQYADFPAVEWVLYFRNGGTENTPLLSDIRALDTQFTASAPSGYRLHHFKGGVAEPEAYRPYTTELAASSTLSLSGAGGRPSNKDMPFFNLECAGEGIVAAVAWPGQWACSFVRDAEDGVSLVAGQETTRFVLYPGEEVRTPGIVLLFWKDGDWIDAQNLWRRWMMAHGMPKPGGELPAPMILASSSRAYVEMHGANEQNQIMFIDRYLEEGLKLDYWWMDAGWYPCDGSWPNVGTWEVDPERFPNGLKPISDHAHANGMKTLLWFEPERVTAGRWITLNHPEWVLGGAQGGLLDLGNPEARTWLTDHVDSVLTDNGIDLYRQDFNMDPLPFWQGRDEENRQGISEIRHLTGYLAYWDELLRRHPGMLIDTCASGGRRNDLETLRRAVPLWRSDYAFEPIGHQGMTYGISFLIPFHGTGTVAHVDAPYYGAGKTPVQPDAFWSNACPSISCGFDLRIEDLDYEALRTLFAQWRRIAPYYYGDFYPLTPYSAQDDAWMGWQLNAPELKGGFLQAFRRQNSDVLGLQLRLRGLERAGTYSVEFFAKGALEEYTGAALIEQGVKILIDNAPGYEVVRYELKP